MRVVAAVGAEAQDVIVGQAGFAECFYQLGRHIQAVLRPFFRVSSPLFLFMLRYGRGVMLSKPHAHVPRQLVIRRMKHEIQNTLFKNTPFFPDGDQIGQVADVPLRHTMMCRALPVGYGFAMAQDIVLRLLHQRFVFGCGGRVPVAMWRVFGADFRKKRRNLTFGKCHGNRRLGLSDRRGWHLSCVSGNFCSKRTTESLDSHILSVATSNE